MVFCRHRDQYLHSYACVCVTMNDRYGANWLDSSSMSDLVLSLFHTNKIEQRLFILETKTNLIWIYN